MPLSNPFCHLVSLQTGHSSSETAASGVDVVFTEEFVSIPSVSITPRQKDAVWLTAVATTGFSWEGDDDNATIDWIAIGKNG